MADTKTVVIYNGSPGLPKEVADCITEDNNDGVEVTWDPAYEARSGEMIEEIVVSLMVTSSEAAAGGRGQGWRGQVRGAMAGQRHSSWFRTIGWRLVAPCSRRQRPPPLPPLLA